MENTHGDKSPLERKTVSVEEAAKILGISRAYAYQMAREGQLPGCKKIGSRFIISKKLLNDYIDGEPNE
jgi:excisionase family DNA binding protein